MGMTPLREQRGTGPSDQGCGTREQMHVDHVEADAIRRGGTHRTAKRIGLREGSELGRQGITGAEEGDDTPVRGWPPPPGVALPCPGRPIR